MTIIECYQKNSTWFKNAGNFVPRGVLWHSTGANNPTLRRYVQPHESDANYDEMIALIGENQYRNDWNHIEREAGLNYWIGKLKGGNIATIKAGPDTKKPWGCGGSLNNTHLQFEICEGSLDDETYFWSVYKEAIELTAHLCKTHNLDPLGSFVYNGKTVPVITDHQESHKLGMGSNHGDVKHWFTRYLGKNYLDRIRQDVKAELDKTSNVVPEVEKPVQNEVFHIVKHGDTLWAIASKYLGAGKRYPEIKEANGLTSNVIYSGMKLKIPTAQHTDLGNGIFEEKKKSIDEIAREVIQGKWKNQPERQKLLEAAGYNYSQVQKRVNELLRK